MSVSKRNSVPSEIYYRTADKLVLRLETANADLVASLDTVTPLGETLAVVPRSVIEAGKSVEYVASTQSDLICHFDLFRVGEDWVMIRACDFEDLPRSIDAGRTIRQGQILNTEQAVSWLREHGLPMPADVPVDVHGRVKADGAAAGSAKAETVASPDTRTGCVKTKPKRSTVKGEAREKLIAALILHHKYENGSCLTLDPIGERALARAASTNEAKVSPSTAGALFKKAFNGLQAYKVVCRSPGRLAEALKVLNGEFSPQELYGRNPPDEGSLDRDE